jgi:cytidylate kinase
MALKYNNITVSGKIAVGTTTLAKNLRDELGWQYYNTGAMQREFDRKEGRNENAIGAQSRTDEHERAMEAMTKRKLTEEKNIVYEAWLSGFVAKDIPGVLKVLVICSDYNIRVDRVVNREKITVEEAKAWMRQREEENIPTWQRLYGKHDFWDPKLYDVVIDTFSTGPMESLGIVLDKLGYKS